MIMYFNIFLLVFSTFIFIALIILISVLFIAKDKSKDEYGKFAVSSIQVFLIIVLIFSAKFFYVDLLKIIHNDNIIYVFGLTLAVIVGLLNRKILKL